MNTIVQLALALLLIILLPGIIVVVSRAWPWVGVVTIVLGNGLLALVVMLIAVLLEGGLGFALGYGLAVAVGIEDRQTLGVVFAISTLACFWWYGREGRCAGVKKKSQEHA